ncbi:MAG TPA: protein translocase subunit SecF [Gemmatimonadaceae bacterium]|nr:protein translocase subunit SecF [Gemmatimonadaceae bacterium]
MLRILHNTKIDFIRLWKQAAIVIVVFLIPAVVMIAMSGFNWSIEFTGGTRIQLQFQNPADVSAVRAELATAGFPNAEIATFGSPNELMIRVQDPTAVAQQDRAAGVVVTAIRAALDRRFGAGSYTVVGAEAVSAKVGDELSGQAALAVLIAFGITLIYLAWRFEWRFALATILATMHDIVATLAFMKYLNLEISLFVVGGILTVIGYSMNDKVVVFDRVRENLKKGRKLPLYDLLNQSVNETLPRTVMTGSTTLACLLALLIFGGDVIRPFAWVLTFGIIIGTFSSIYVASPILLWIERKYPRLGVDKAHISASQARAESQVEPAPRPIRGSKAPATGRR